MNRARWRRGRLSVLIFSPSDLQRAGDVADPAEREGSGGDRAGHESVGHAGMVAGPMKQIKRK